VTYRPKVISSINLNIEMKIYTGCSCLRNKVLIYEGGTSLVFMNDFALSTNDTLKF